MSIGHMRGEDIEINGKNYPVKYAVINLADTGDIVAAVTGKKIRLVSLFFVASAAVTLTLRSTTTALSGAMAFAQNGGLMLPVNQFGWVQTAKGGALNLLMGSAVQVSGAANYIEVDGD